MERWRKTGTKKKRERNRGEEKLLRDEEVK